MILIDDCTRDSRVVRRDRRFPNPALAHALLLEASEGIGQAGDLVGDDEVSAMLRSLADGLAGLADRLPA